MTPVRMECPISPHERTSVCVFAADFTALIGYSLLLSYSLYENQFNGRKGNIKTGISGTIVMSQQCDVLTTSGYCDLIQERSFCNVVILHRLLLMR
jgi:hypothetical protein